MESLDERAWAQAYEVWCSVAAEPLAWPRDEESDAAPPVTREPSEGGE